MEGGQAESAEGASDPAAESAERLLSASSAAMVRASVGLRTVWPVASLCLPSRGISQFPYVDGKAQTQRRPYSSANILEINGSERQQEAGGG